MIIKIARGNEEEMIEFVIQRGIPRSIAEGLVGVIRGKIESVIDNLKSLASHPVIGIPQPLIDTFVNIIVNPSQLNVKKTVNELALSIFDILERRVPSSRLPQTQFAKPVLPMLIQIIWELKNGELDSAIALLKKLNKTLFDSAEKKVSFERSLQLYEEAPSADEFIRSPHTQQFFNLFTSHNVPTFCLPPYLLPLLEIVKSLFVPSQNNAVSIETIRLAGFEVLKHFVKIDEEVLDFCSLVFHLTKERLVPSSSSAPLTREAQDKVIERFASHVGFPSYPFKILMAFAFKDKRFDPDFIREIAEIVGGDSEVSKYFSEFLEIGFGLYSLFQTKNIKTKLLKIADKYGVDPHTAYAFLQISSKRPPSSKGWQNFMTSELCEAVAKGLRISKNEVVGLVSLLKGDFSNRNIDLVLKSFCQRSKLDKQLRW